MPTAAEHNGSGPPNSHPHRAARGERQQPESVTNGGPFDLGEIERLANEMFRALPGAVLPGLDAEQLASVPSPSEAESLRPPAGMLPTPNGHLTNGTAAIRDPSAGPGEITGLLGEAADATTPEQWSYPPQAPRPDPSGPAPLPPSTGRWIFTLSGDPMSLAELGLADAPRGALQDPFGGSHYLLEEAARLTNAPAADEPVASPFPARVAAGAHPAFDVYALRRDFPVLAETVHGRPLVWLDNGATTQKPVAVIERLEHFYRHENSNIHRGAHELAARATDAYEHARDKAAGFLHASSSDEIVFVRGTTEAINLVAQAWGRANVGPGDEILITWLEHHANIVPWQQLCQATGARLCVAPVDDRGQVMLDEYERLLSDRTRIVAFSHVSNALGTITPVARDDRARAPLRRARARSTERRPCRTCPSTCSCSTATGTRSPATRCSARPGSASCTESRTCSTRCPHGRAAAT